MTCFSPLRVLALAATTWLVSGCGHKEDVPQPTPIAALTTHTVAVRYQARLLGGATAGLPKQLNLVVAYERVEQTDPTQYHLSAPSVQFHDLAVSDTAQEVPLSRLATYPGIIRPKITVSMWEDQQSRTTATVSYEMTCDLLLDGKVAEHTTYAVTAGQLPPLVVNSHTELAP